MANVNELTPLNIRELTAKGHLEKPVSGNNSDDSKDFGETISDFLSAVNENQKQSREIVADVIQGRSENLHEAMAVLEEAKLSFQLMIEIRNKLVESYKELERMPI